MYIKAVSIQSLIAKIYRDLKPSYSGWVNDAVEWIGEGLEIIGHGVGYIRKPIVHEVIDYRARLKCNVHAIEAIEYDGKRLKPSDAINSIKTNNKNNITGFWYTLNPNYIHTSFEKGKITIYADVIATDKDGYPLVPDAPLHREALKWYVLMMYLSQGYKHPVFSYKDAEERWNLYYPQAQNEGNFPDIDGFDNFKRMWTPTIPFSDPASVFFDNNSDPVRDSQYVLTPKENSAMIIHVETPGDDIVGGGSL